MSQRPNVFRSAEDWLEHFGDWFAPEPNTGCWLWMRTGARYGEVKVGGVTRLAHRVAYELLRGPIPKGLTIDHLCRNTFCVNPDHMEPVTMRENILRGTGVASRNAAKKQCIRGHNLSEENIMWVGRERRCRQCHNRRSRESRWRRAGKA